MIRTKAIINYTHIPDDSKLFSTYKTFIDPEIKKALDICFLDYTNNLITCGLLSTLESSHMSTDDRRLIYVINDSMNDLISNILSKHKSKDISSTLNGIGIFSNYPESDNSVSTIMIDNRSTVENDITMKDKLLKLAEDYLENYMVKMSDMLKSIEDNLENDKIKIADKLDDDRAIIIVIDIELRLNKED